MYSWLRRLTRSFEESTTPLPYFGACFFLWVALRIVIEAYVFRIALPPLICVHFGLFYVSLVLTLSLALGIVAGRSPIRILRVQLVGFLFVLLAPSLDYLLFRPIDYEMGYLHVDDLAQLVQRYFTFFGPLEPTGITPGMRIEIALVLAAVFFYLHATTRSLGRAVVGVIAAWTVVFLHCAIRPVLHLLSGALGLLHIEGFDLYIRTFTLASALAALGIVALSAPKMFWAVVRDSRFQRTLHYGMLFVLGLGLADAPEPFRLQDGLGVVLGLASLWLVWVFSVMANNVYDIEIDRINAPTRPLVTGELEPKTYLNAAFWLFVIAASMAATASFSVLWFVLVFGAAYFVYSAPPLRLKTRCFVSKAVIGINSTASMLAGYTLWSNDLLSIPAPAFWIVFVGFSLGAHVIDLKDIEGDRAAGITNLSTFLGQRRAQWLLASLSLLAHVALGWALRESWVGPVVGALGVVQFFALARKTYRDGFVMLVENVTLACMVVHVWQQ